MTRLSSIAIAIGASMALALAAAAFAAPVEQSRDVPGFKKIALHGGIDADITVGGAQSVVIETEADQQERIKTDVRNGTLHIEMRGRRNFNDPVFARITAPELNGFDVNGSSDAQIAGVDSKSFELEINGSGDVRIAGRCDRVEYEINGSGDIAAADFACGDASVEISGSGDAAVYASGDVEIEINGSGDVVLHGDGRIVEMDVSGSGDVERAGRGD